MDTVDITIIGAGVVGLAVASEVGRPGREVLVLEKNRSWGQETSSRNSEVIHAGIYYPPGSLKAQGCCEGRKMLYAMCPRQGIPIKKVGKLIVATEEREIGMLEQLQKTAAGNGVDLFFLDGEEVRRKEPRVFAKAALFSPETGIVDSHQLMKFFLEKARSQGAQDVYEAEVTAVHQQGGQYRVDMKNQGEEVSILSRVVINCAGNNADKIAAACGIDIDAAGYRQYYLKGSYFRLADKYRQQTQHLVYPVPEKNSLGIHTVLDLNGGVRLGPDEEEVPEIDYQVDERKRSVFFEEARKFLPFIREGDLTADMAGVRPQLLKPNRGNFKDFIIAHEEQRGFPGLINLVGIESPGLTASPYIGRRVAEIAGKILG